MGTIKIYKLLSDFDSIGLSADGMTANAQP